MPFYDDLLFQTKLLLKIAHDESMLKKAINAVDMGLLMGNEFRKELTKTASLLCTTLQENYIGRYIIFQNVFNIWSPKINCFCI